MRKFIIKFISNTIPIKTLRHQFRDKYLPKKEIEFTHDFETDYHFVPSSENPLILDCGANIGESVKFLKKQHPTSRIIAYEADSQIFQEKLIPNLTSNGALPSGVECVNKAVWIHTNGVSFFPEGDCSGSLVTQHVKSASATHVPSFRLRDELRKYSKIDFLKIDIEGAELEVMQDCSCDLEHIDHIFCEYHAFTGKKQKLSVILTILEEAGFRYRITEDYNPSKSYLVYNDNGNGMDCQVKIFAINNKLIKNIDQ